jgi:hypothetical protein
MSNGESIREIVHRHVERVALSTMGLVGIREALGRAIAIREEQLLADLRSELEWARALLTPIAGPWEYQGGVDWVRRRIVPLQEIVADVHGGLEEMKRNDAALHASGWFLREAE